jgi:hypothetical protein
MFPQEEWFEPESIDAEPAPQIVGSFSMRMNELQVQGYTGQRFTAQTATHLLAQQHHLLQDIWSVPCQALGREEAELQELALHTLSLQEVQKVLMTPIYSPGDPASFCLTHPDLRVDNIIVDDRLHIRGIIDWEFSSTVPRHAFLPPSWVTGHDMGSKAHWLSEFMSVLSSKAQSSPQHSQLAQDWDFGDDDMRLPMAYILLDPSDLTFIFYKYIYAKLSQEPRGKAVQAFFQRPENVHMQGWLQRRLDASERYTQYLKDNLLFDDEEENKWEQVRAWTAETQEKLQRLRDWNERTEEELNRLASYQSRYRFPMNWLIIMV